MNDYRPEIRSLLKTLKSNRFVPVSINNGEEIIKADSMTSRKFLEEIVAVDQVTLLVQNNKGVKCKLFLVYGNEPGVVVCDYTDHPDLEKAVDAHYDAWEGKKQPTM
jgi:ribosomal protein S5